MHGCETHPTGGAVDEHMFTRLQVTADIEHEVGREIIHRQGGGLGERHVMGKRKHLTRRHDHLVCIATEACQRHDVLAGGQTRHRRPGLQHAARDFVTHHHRWFGAIGIKSLAGEHIGEIDTAGVHGNTHPIRCQ